MVFCDVCKREVGFPSKDNCMHDAIVCYHCQADYTDSQIAGKIAEKKEELWKNRHRYIRVN